MVNESEIFQLKPQHIETLLLLSFLDLVDSLDKGFQDEIEILETHIYEHNIFPLCWQQFFLKKSTY